MIRKSTLLAVVASAALGLAMLAPTAASAKHGGGATHTSDTQTPTPKPPDGAQNGSSDLYNPF